MKSIFSLTFLWAMSIGILIIPSLVAFPAYINLAGLIIVLLLHLTFNNNFRTSNRFLLPVAFYIFLSSALSADQGVLNFSKQLFSLGFLTVVFASATEKQHTRLIQTYIVFCFIMSFCGALASIMVNTQMVSINEFKVNLTELSDSRFNWDEDLENGFNAPYGLGLVLTKGSTLYYFLSIPFFRSSGWSYEPTFASFFVVPSLILLIREKFFSRRLQITMGIVIVFFLLCCFSVASIAALLSLLVIFKLLEPKKRIINKLLWIGLLGIVGFFVVNFYNARKSDQPGIDLVESKLTEESLSGVNVFKFSGGSLPELIQPFIIILYIGMVIWIAVPAIRSSGINQTMGLILVYLILHSVKGSWYHTITLNFPFIFFLYLVNVNRREVPSLQLTSDKLV